MPERTLGHGTTRLLGVGLTAALAAVTLALAATGRLDLYINPDSAWFAVSMAVLALIGCAASFALPLGAEADHGHDHGDGDSVSSRASGARSTSGGGAAAASIRSLSERSETKRSSPTLDTHRSSLGTVAVAAGGVLATGIVGAVLLVPPTTLSAELAMSRDTGAAPLFQGADTVTLAATGDTGSFGVGEWASVFATATNPEAFDGDEVTLTGFVTPGDGGFALTRLVITHCVIDAQPASVPIATTGAGIPETGEWVTVTGTIRDIDGSLRIQPGTVTVIDEPADPYEY